MRIGTIVSAAVVALLGAAVWLPGPSAAAASPAPFPSWTALVDRQYADLVGRAPTASERTSAVAGLVAGSSVPGELIAGLRAGPDAVENVDPVVRLYRAFFLRIPDRGGLEFWIERRRTGTWRLVRIADTFATSSEFRRRYGALGDRAFVELIYANVLERVPDVGGVGYWTRQLELGRRSRGAVMANFSESAEYRRKQAAEVHASVLPIGLLGRAPAPGEFGDAVADLESGGSVGEYAQRIFDSSEYHERIAPGSTTTTTSTSLTSTTSSTSTTTTTAPPVAPLVLDEDFGGDGEVTLAPVDGASKLLPARDGGFFRAHRDGRWVLERYGSTGALVDGFDPGPWFVTLGFVGERANGEVLVVGQFDLTFSTTWAITTVDAAGTRPTADDLIVLAPTGASWVAGDLSPAERMAVAGWACSGATCRIEVKAFDADGAATRSWQHDLGADAGGRCDAPEVQVVAFDDGSAVAAITRCDASRTTPTGVEVVRFSADGGLDEEFGGGDGVLSLRSVDAGGDDEALQHLALAGDGSVLVASTSGAARRSGPDGTPDASFGIVDLAGLVGGPVVDVAAEALRYHASSVDPIAPCSTSAATIRSFDASGAALGEGIVLPASLDGASIAASADGSLLVSGTSRTPIVSDGATTCGAPFTTHLARLVPS